ncbi:hypothetical protein RclHR1_13450002 [Rhizophagus clarus]|uniref:Uncharacterized protein n=1 Tax=Rhizophagus clarus TaxID=94130 RepID=A0A2Z6R2I6_9GLOM|nr:hypothetical protein RclHR1_13450002 [Rhizophagus clarus]
MSNKSSQKKKQTLKEIIVLDAKHSEAGEGRTEIIEDEGSKAKINEEDLAGKSDEHIILCRLTDIERELFKSLSDKQRKSLLNTIKKAMAKAKAEGRAEGRAEGKAEGRAEGRAEGKAEGIAEAFFIVAFVVFVMNRVHRTLVVTTICTR